MLALDEKTDHVRGAPTGPLILEYGDYECPYSRQAFRAIEQVEGQLDGNMRFAFRHFPLTSIHPHALAAASAAEAAAMQDRFWDMHELLFHWQKALEDDDLRRYAAQLGLDVAAFDRDRASAAVAGRIRRDVDSGLASGQVLGTPTLFIGGLVYRGGYDPPTLLAALTSQRALRDPGLRGVPPARHRRRCPAGHLRRRCSLGQGTSRRIRRGSGSRRRGRGGSTRGGRTWCWPCRRQPRPGHRCTS
jgi:Thioredoxin